MKKFLIIAPLLLALATGASGKDNNKTKDTDPVTIVQKDKRITYDLRLGYSLGGTVPTDFPASLRKINSFSPKLSYRFGIDVEYHFTKKWGLQSGLWIERKGFSGDMAVRQYEMTVDKGEDKLHGIFTGNVYTSIVQTGFTIPLMGTWAVNKNCKLKLGPYLSIITDRTFSGYAYNGYLREGNSKGKLTEMGDDPESRGEFDGKEFDEGLRRIQVGLDLGVDWYFSKHWGVTADVTYGFNSAFKSDFETITMGLHPVYANFGVIYKLGK